MKEYPYWWDDPVVGAGTVPLGDSPSHSLPSRADVVVIGAGYTGLAAARVLARRGASVVVAERERIGSGASSRNGGQVLTGLKLEPAALTTRFGDTLARRLFDVSLESLVTLERVMAEEGMDCEFQRTGHVQAASKPAHFKAFQEEQQLLARVFRHRVELVPRAEQSREIGTSAYHGLLVDERSGALNPARYVRQLAEAACRAGAVIAEATPVTRVERQDQRWRVTTSRGAVDAADLLIATNGYTDQAVPDLQRRLIPIGSYVIATAPLGPTAAAALLPTGRMAFDSKHFLSYFRLTRDHRLLFGGRVAFSRPTPQSTRRRAALLRSSMVSIFPALASTEIEYGWSGNVAFTRDQLPHGGELSNAYYAGGYCGHGVAMATHLGEQIARRMLGERFEHPLFDRPFPPIPFYRGTPWFLPFVGVYYRTKDLLQ